MRDASGARLRAGMGSRGDTGPSAVAALGPASHRGRTQNPLTFSRPPVTVFPLNDAVGTVALRMAFLIVAALAPGLLAA